MVHDRGLLAAYRGNAEALGRMFPDLGEAAKRASASTDMGNVSLRFPSIHPMLAVDGRRGEPQPDFAAACVAESADRAAIDGAVAMAWTAIDAAAEDPLRDRLLTGSDGGGGRRGRSGGCCSTTAAS